MKKRLTILDAQPIMKALRDAGYKPKVVGSIKTRGFSNNDIDINLPVSLRQVDAPIEGMTLKGMIDRCADNLSGYQKAMRGLGFDLVCAPPFSPVDVWHKRNIKVDVFLKQPAHAKD